MVYTFDNFLFKLWCNQTRGHHVYKCPSIEEVVSLQTDAKNEHDAYMYAVGTTKGSTVAGHAPRELRVLGTESLAINWKSLYLH